MALLLEEHSTALVEDRDSFDRYLKDIESQEEAIEQIAAIRIAESKPVARAVISEALAAAVLTIYEECRAIAGKWKIPTEQTQPIESVRAHRVYVLSKSVSKILKRAITQIDEGHADRIKITRELELHEADTRLDKFMEFLEKFWAVEYTEMWQSGKIKPVTVQNPN